MRLIPKDLELGWTPYAWLVYLAIFWMGALIPPPTPTRVGLTVLGTVVFLPLYFWGYWQHGRRQLLGRVALGTSRSRISSPPR